MLLRCSGFVHQLPVGADRILIVHAVLDTRLPADREVGILLDYFAKPRRIPEDLPALAAMIPYEPDAIERVITDLVERRILTDKTPEEEMAMLSAELAPTHGRSPSELLDKYRRGLKEGASHYWSAGEAYGMRDLGTVAMRVDALLFGDCDIQMEADFLRREAARRGVDLHVAATFPDDARFAEERRHDVIFIGALRARHMIIEAPASGATPHAAYIAQARHLLMQLRARSSAPILLDNLPEPTVQPLGLAERGLAGHRTRFRRANVALAKMTAAINNVYLIDVAAALAAHGAETMLDDGLVGFTHFGSPGWLLQRPEREKAAVHDLFPDVTPLVQELGGDPYGRETLLASTHLDALITILGIGRKKCVIVDLDGILWPGVLAETKSPFAWTPEISGGFSYIGLYFGLHEALLYLKKRGILLACISKNDEATVRELWTYPDHYPRQRLLSPDDFVTWRINWNDKVDNILSIADELGFALETFLFIDDHPVERDRVRQRLPAVEVWGEDLFTLRRRLLNDPRLQLAVITTEASARGALAKAQIERRHLRAEMMDEKTYITSLNIRCTIEQETAQSNRLDRVEELFQRTTQFNATGRKFSRGELDALVAKPNAFLFTIDVTDRFGDHGLVGAAVIAAGEIIALAMSCRVLGMGIEHTFMRHILAHLRKTSSTLAARIVESPRNVPVRNIYRDHGFEAQDNGVWLARFS
jgi:FkbH-like protein